MSSTEKKPAPIIFGDETLSDVTLVVGNQDFKTNKMFLAYHSGFFKAMFYGNFKESKEDRVEIKDVSVTNFRRLLEIIHNGKISDTHEFMEFPFARGKHYVIYCYNGYGERTDDQNASHHTNSQQDFFYNFWKSTTEILNIADRFNLSPMVKDYFGYIIPLSISYCGQDWCHICLKGP